MFQFNCKLIKTDITAIKFYKNYILIGNGNFLVVYNRNIPNNCILQLQVFEKRKIHGILTDEFDHRLLIYGENALKLFQIDQQNDFKLIELKEIFLKDWILTVRFVNKDHIALINMNNNFLLFDRDLEEIQRIPCREKCILYSAFIIVDNNKVIAVSGTVFNEIVIWTPCAVDNQILAKLQSHNGVIFSLDYNETNLCSTSDDRSAILWKFQFEPTLKIEEKCRVYGHESRVFRCKILTNSFLTCGEDTRVNLWNFNGDLLRRFHPHCCNNGGTIWTLDYDINRSTVITGCSDGSVALFPIYYQLIDEKITINHSDNNDLIPKYIGIVSDNNIVTITENGGVFYYFADDSKWLKLNQHDDLKKYVIFQISNCRRLLLLGGYNGQLYLYKYSNNCLQYQYCYQLVDKHRIFAIHWLTCTKFLICIANGRLLSFEIGDNFELKQTIKLPSIKTTTTAILLNDNTIIGDRNGNIYAYSEGNDLKQIKRVHSHLGVSKIIKTNANKIATIGRDSLLNSLEITNKIESNWFDKLPFTWLCDYFCKQQLIIGFNGNRFLLYDYRNKQNLLEINCGGGHRSWDCHLKQNQLKFVYVKNKTINSLQYDLNDIRIRTILDNYHTNIVNKIIKIECFNRGLLLISGGEDTCLYLHLYYKRQLINLYKLKIHLSSIKSLCEYRLNNREYLIFSGGGRGEIICTKLQINPDISFNKQSRYYNDASIDVRIMDLSVNNFDDYLLLFCGCSDGNIKIINIVYNQNDNKFQMVLFKQLFYKLCCLLTIRIVEICNYRLLLSSSTDGRVNFWDISQIDANNRPFKSLQLHQSGINSLDYRVDDNKLILITGGDDNRFVIDYLQLKSIDNCVDLIEIDRFTNTNLHCAQITGIYQHCGCFLTVSIDQKLLIHQFFVDNNRIVYKFLDCYHSSISDIQGIECCTKFNDCNRQKCGIFNVFLYGKGLEFIQCVEK